MIDVKKLEKAFHGNLVLKGIDEKIEKGEKVVIVGPSGSGKSTFLRCLNRLEEPTGGEIWFEGTNIVDKKCDINKLRQKMGMVFQQFNLFAHLSVRENITLAPVRLGLMSQEQADRKAAELLAKTPHLRREGIHCCSELYSMCSMVLAPLAPEGGGFFSDTGDILSGIQSLATRAQVLDWLAMLGRQLEAQMDALESGHSDPLEKAREYVRQHVDERILLQEAAAAAGLSPSYLSALFKKEYNQNFMDFVNETKMRRACQLIREGKYRIYEISYMLSFENAYYFTRVFRRHVGMTPTEYQRRLRPDSET